MIYRSLLILCVITASSLNADEVSFTPTDGGATIHLDGKQFATFVHTESPVGRPYISNLFTTDHIKVTRNHPTTKDDPDDHPHHQGIFFTWGQLNGLDYWHMRGRTVHDRFLKNPTNGKIAYFSTRSYYLADDNKSRIAREDATYTFRKTPFGILVTLQATVTGESAAAIFGSKEEGGLAVRMSKDLTVDAGASMTDDEGRHGGGEIWGKDSKWVDYAGEKQARWVGVTLFTNPASFRKCWWHARDYGLLAANPLGPLNDPKQSVVLKKGESFTVHYGVMIHSNSDQAEYSPAKAYKYYLSQMPK